MAILVPTLNEIQRLKVKPQDGELYLLNFLASNLDNSFEVFFNPYLNGDRPDIVILRKHYGVMIIEVKDYNLDSYELDERKNWKVKNQPFKIKSPIAQVNAYKGNLFNLHIENLLELKIKDIRHFNIVSTVLYFHNARSNKINELIIEPFSLDQKYIKFLKYNIDLLGRDNLNEHDFNLLLRRRHMMADISSFLFTEDIYKSFKRFLKPPIHLQEEGIELRYSTKQLEIIHETKKEQRIKGVVGSGKTTVLAARAIQAYKRTNGKILILTYNITLKNYIRDKISKVREEFAWENFIILNYHLFINIELNNLEVPIIIPEGFDQYTEEEKDEYLEENYYSNKPLFLDKRDNIRQYDVILIDEIQDYKRPWMEIIKECFLAKGGEYVLFGDVKQNIYSNKIEGKDISTNVRGVTELKNSYRSDFKIKDLAIAFQKEVFKDKYEVDTFNSRSNNLELDFERNQLGTINYIYLPQADSTASLYTIIHDNAIHKNISPNDITILGHSISLLKKFDSFYRYASNERTNTMFETSEMMYLMGLNYLRAEKPKWLLEGLKLIKRLEDRYEAKGFNQLSILFVIYDLYKIYPERFETRMRITCEKFLTDFNSYSNYYDQNKDEIAAFKTDCGYDRQKSNIETIRKNKKLNFNMNSGTVKISTVHSFKGWESETLFLIIEKKFSALESAFDEILYTGITRSRANLIIINFGNEEYNQKLKTVVGAVK